MRCVEVAGLLRNANVRFHLLFAILFCFPTVSQSQNLINPHYSSDYYFINTDSSYLYNAENNANLQSLFAKMDNMYFNGDEGLTIMQIGGSHVQGGVWSWTLRRHFESLCHDNDGDYGLLFPFSLAKTNHPYYYISKSSGVWMTDKVVGNAGEPVGLSGMVAYTSDSVAELIFQFARASLREKHKFTKATLIHGADDTCYNIYTNADSLLLSKNVFQADGYTEFCFSQPMDTLSFRFVRKDTIPSTMHVYGVIVEDTVPKVKYINIGVNGAATESYIKAEKFFEQLKLVCPDLAILSIGVNDAAAANFTPEKFIENYKVIVNAILDNNPNCAIIFTTNNDFCNYRKGPNQNQPDVCRSMRILADHYNASVWDLYEVMGGYKSINKWCSGGLAQKDKIHFTPQGYIVVADLLFDAILNEYEKHLTK